MGNQQQKIPYPVIKTCMVVDDINKIPPNYQRLFNKALEDCYVISITEYNKYNKILSRYCTELDLPRILVKMNYISFLKTKLNVDVCGSDYPYYCNSASDILCIYLRGTFNINCLTVAGYYSIPTNMHAFIRMIDSNNIIWTIDPTPIQFESGTTGVWDYKTNKTIITEYTRYDVNDNTELYLGTCEKSQLDKSGRVIKGNLWVETSDNEVMYPMTYEFINSYHKYEWVKYLDVILQKFAKEKM